MAGSNLREAQRRRAEERRRRREGADADGSGDSDELLHSVKEAGRTAAAAAAVGAATAAVRALAERSRRGDADHDKAQEPDEQPKDEQPTEEAQESDEQPTDEAQEPDEHPTDEQPHAKEDLDEQLRGLAQVKPQPTRTHERTDAYARAEPQEGAEPAEVGRVVDAARSQLSALLGKEPEGVSSLERMGEGWLVTLEVVEVTRIPSSTDVLASYEIILDDDRRLVRYGRGRRYYRGRAEGGDAP